VAVIVVTEAKRHPLGYIILMEWHSIRQVGFDWILLKVRFLLFLSVVGNVYIADTYNHRVRKVTVSTGIISTIAGTGTSSYSGDGGDATSAALNSPTGVVLDSSGIL